MLSFLFEKEEENESRKFYSFYGQENPVLDRKIRKLKTEIEELQEIYIATTKMITINTLLRAEEIDENIVTVAQLNESIASVETMIAEFKNLNEEIDLEAMLRCDNFEKNVSLEINEIRQWDNRTRGQ
jgi:hypothetical protein